MSEMILATMHGIGIGAAGMALFMRFRVGRIFREFGEMMGVPPEKLN